MCTRILISPNQSKTEINATNLKQSINNNNNTLKRNV